MLSRYLKLFDGICRAFDDPPVGSTGGYREFDTLHQVFIERTLPAFHTQLAVGIVITFNLLEDLLHESVHEAECIYATARLP